MLTSPSLDVRDKPATFPLSQIPLRRLSCLGKFQGSQRNGIWAKGDVTGSSQTSRRTSRHSGIWALSCRRATCQPCSCDNGQSSAMLSLTTSSQPTLPMSLADDCHGYSTTDTASSLSSSSTSSFQLQHHLDELQSPPSTSTTAVTVVCSSDG